MNRFTRTCIITALILIVLGAGITAAGASMGGFSQLRRSSGKTVFDIFDRSISIGGNHLNMDEDRSQPMLTGDYANEQLAKAGEVTELDAEIGGGQLIIKQSDNEYFKVEVNTQLQFQCFAKEGKLSLKAFEGRTSPDTSHNTITLYIPEGASIQDVNISLGAGTVNVDKLSAGNVTFEVGAGTVNVDNMDAHKVSADLGAGKMTINGKTMDADIDIGMGSLKWTGDISRDMDLSCSMVSVEIGLKGQEEKGHNYSISCAAGQVTVGGRKYAAGAGDMDIDNGAPGTYEIDCSMGNVNIYFEE
jgi:hypothetical protein